MEYEKFRERLEMLGFSMEDGELGILNIYSPSKEKVLVAQTTYDNEQYALNLPHNGVILSPETIEEIFDVVLKYTKTLIVGQKNGWGDD